MKTVTFTDEELNSLLLMVDYLKDSEEKHFEEASAEFDLAGPDEYQAALKESANHVYAHTLRVRDAVRGQITNA